LSLARKERRGTCHSQKKQFKELGKELVGGANAEGDLIIIATECAINSWCGPTEEERGVVLGRLIILIQMVEMG